MPTEYRVRPLLDDRTLPTVTLKNDEGALVEVLDTEKRPVEGALVVLEYHGGGDWGVRERVRGWRPAYRMGRVEEDGIAKVPYLDGEILEMGILHPDYRPWSGRLKSDGPNCEIALKAVSTPRTVRVTQGGRPLAGALLTNGFVPLAVTDANGQAGLFYRSAMIWVQTEDGRRHFHRLQPEQDDIALEAESWVAGEVVNSETGEGVAGALVWDEFHAFSVRANDEGRFQWPEDFSTSGLGAGYPGYASVTPRNLTTGYYLKRTDEGLRFHLLADQKVRGRVVDSRGMGLEGVVVQLRRWIDRKAISGPFQETLTNSQGEFYLSGPAHWDTYEVLASSLGKVTARQKVSLRSLAESKEDAIELVLETGPSLTGRVVGEASQPLEGVRVELFGLSRADGRAFDGPDGLSAPAASTYGNGRFEVVKMLPGRHVLALRAEGYAPHFLPPMPIGARMGEKDIGDLVLEKEASLTLRLVDAEGRPVSDVRCLVDLARASERDDVPEGLHNLLRQVGKSDTDGRVRFDGLQAGEDLVLWIRHPRYVPQQLQVKASGGVLDVILDRGATLRGRVVDASGQEAAHGSLAWKTETLSTEPGVPDILLVEGVSGLRAGETGADGTFEISGVPDGQVTLSAQLGRYQVGETVVEVSRGADVEGLRVQLATLEVQGKVVDEEGAAVPDIQVSVTHRKAENHTESHSAKTDTEGRFHFTSLPIRPATINTRDRQGRSTRPVDL